MKSTETTMLVFRDMVGVAIDSEGTILDTICVPTHNRSEICVVCFSISKVLSGVVIAQDNILDIARSIRHKEGDQTSSIRDELCSNVLSCQSDLCER